MSLETPDTAGVENIECSIALEGDVAAAQRADFGELHEDRIWELNKSYGILMDIIRQNKTTCWPFMDEVDIKGLGLWDYCTKVKEPMWLNKIIDKFDKSQYPGITEFAKDFRTMVENCYRYNGTDHVISKKAKRLEMALEGKLALLRKDLRDKASLGVTSNGKFSVEMNNDGLVPVSRYGRLGSNREYASILDGDSAKLVYDFVRCEETMLQDDEKKASHRERRQQEMLYQQIASSWISTIEEIPDLRCIKTCHALPELGFFFHLCETTLKLPELSMYQLERCLLIPEHSLYLARIMTSLLCSYQERSQISQRPPMHFETWNKRVKERLVKWFELVQKYNCYMRAARKLGISLEFFESLEWKNPFVAYDKRKFSELKYEQRVQILKALCDSLVLLQSVQNTLSTMDASQLQCMQLGKDYLGNVYIYFPQFCGDDVRVYRHRQFGEHVPITAPEEIWTPPRPPSPDVISKSGELLENQPVDDETQKDDKQMPHANENGLSGGDDEIVHKGMDSYERRSEMKQKINPVKCESSEIKEENEVHVTESFAIESVGFELKEESKSSLNESINSESVGYEMKQENNFIRNESVTSDSVVSASNSEHSSSVIDRGGADSTQFETAVVGGKRSSRIRKQTTRYADTTTFTPRVRAPRKRDRFKEQNVASDSSTPKKRKQGDAFKGQRSNKEQGQPKKKQTIKYGNVNFEMLCDSIDALQLLINELELSQTEENKTIYSRKAFENHQELIEKVRWLYSELEPWSMKLRRAQLAVQVQMKKEHSEIENLVEKIDPWCEEFSIKNSILCGDNLTVTHTDSPMSSVASFDGDDEEYVHPYFTRKLSTPDIEKVFDEALFEVERESLLPAALCELENVLRLNLKDLLKIADRAELQESNTANDRRTRRKIKHQNKVLGKIILFAERRADTFPSLLPILLPNEDVFEVVDMVFLEEETRLQEVEEEQQRKRAQRSSRRQNSRKLKIEKEKSVLEKVPPILRSPSKSVPVSRVETASIAIRMQNGRVYPATRLSDGRVVPIMRPDNSSAAASVNELIENTHKEIRRNAVDTTPTISLRGGSPRMQPLQIAQTTPTHTKAMVTQTLTVPLINNGNNQPPSTGSNQNNPVPVTRFVRNANPTRPIIINGTPYALVPGASMMVPSQSQATATSSISQPITVLRPLLTPVQIITPALKCQPQNNNVVILPVQNCTSTPVTSMRIGTAPVLGVISSQSRIQFQPQQNKP